MSEYTYHEGILVRRHVAVKGRLGLYWSDTKRGKVYEVAYYDRDGKRHFKTVGPSLEDAIAEHASLTVKLNKGEKAHYEPMTFGAVSEEWAEARLDRLSAGTQTRYRSVLDNYLVPKFGTRKIRSITTDEIAMFLAKLTRLDGEKMAGASKNGVYVVLHSVMDYAANTRRGYLPSNPCDSLETGERPRPDPVAHRVLTPAEAKGLIEHSSEKFRPILMTAMFTGLRAGEVLGLRWDDIDFDLNLIYVRGQIQNGSYRETKGKETRTLPLLPPLRPVLFSLPSRFEAGYVFPDVGYRSLSTEFKQARDKAGIKDGEKKLTMHSCRHTFASALLRDGEDIVWVSSLLGHKSTKVTLETYAHVIQRDNRSEEATMRLKDALGDLG